MMIIDEINHFRYINHQKLLIKEEMVKSLRVSKPKEQFEEEKIYYTSEEDSSDEDLILLDT